MDGRMDGRRNVALGSADLTVLLLVLLVVVLNKRSNK
jgi:hypothetical protein